VQLAVVALVLWGVHRTLLRAWQELQGYQWQLDPLWLALAGAFNLLGFVPAGLFWHRLLRAVGQDAGLGESLRAYFIGQLGKYVPGKFMVLVLRAGLIRSQRVNTTAAALTVFVETLTMMAVGGVVALAILAARFHGQKLLFAAAVVMMLGLLLPTLPPVIRLLARLAGVTRRDPAMAARLEGLTFATLAWGWTAMAIGWVMTGLSLWAVLRAIGVPGLDPVSHGAFFVGAVAMSKVAGFISMLPAGLGVADFAITGLLAEFLRTNLPGTPADSTALIAAVMLRVAWLLSEVIISGILYLVGPRPAPRSATVAGAAPPEEDS